MTKPAEKQLEYREITPDKIRLPECCQNAKDNPDEPCEHVINVTSEVKKTNIGL